MKRSMEQYGPPYPFALQEGPRRLAKGGYGHAGGVPSRQTHGGAQLGLDWVRRRGAQMAEAPDTISMICDVMAA